MHQQQMDKTLEGHVRRYVDGDCGETGISNSSMAGGSVTRGSFSREDQSGLLTLCTSCASDPTEGHGRGGLQHCSWPSGVGSNPGAYQGETG